jgi:hypothetical protein
VCHRVSILLSEGQTRAKQLKAGTNERSRSGPNGRKRPRSLCAYSIVRAKQTSLCVGHETGGCSSMMRRGEEPLAAFRSWTFLFSFTGIPSSIITSSLPPSLSYGYLRIARCSVFTERKRLAVDGRRDGGKVNGVNGKILRCKFHSALFPVVPLPPDLPSQPRPSFPSPSFYFLHL